MIKIYKPTFEQLQQIEQERQKGSDSIVMTFVLVVAISSIVALIALYLDVNKIELNLNYDQAKLLFANCFLVMVHLLFVDNIKSFKVFGWLLSGLFLGLGSFLIWTS